MSKIEEFFERGVEAGYIPQIPMNYDAVAYKIYTGYLENKVDELIAENAELRARLEKAAEEVDKVKKIIEPTMYTSFCGFVVRWCTIEEHKELYGTQEAAEARLKELQGGDKMKVIKMPICGKNNEDAEEK